MIYKRLLPLLLCFSFLNALGQTCDFKGKIVNAKGEELPFVSIYFADAGIGGMSNENGHFKLKVPCGKQEVSFQSLGYKTQTMSLDINGKEQQIELASIAYQIKTVDVDPDKEDPAYNIIRRATVMAELYKKQINGYTARLYVRSYHKFKEIPWIFKKAMEEDELAQELSGDVQESIVEYTFEKPNTVKEKIIARKTARLDTLKQASNFLNLDFYNLGGTDMINPLNRGAFSVYRFEYQHSYFEGEQEVHKIEVIPKRRGNDLMRGYIYINDELFNLNQVEVQFDQDPIADINYFQRYQEVEEGVWMPFNHKIEIAIDFMGVETDVQYLANIQEIDVTLDSLIHQKIKAQLIQNAPYKYGNDSAKVSQKDTVQTEELSKREAKIQELIQKEELNNRETFKLVRLLKKEAEESAENEQKEEDYNLKNQHQLEYAEDAFKAKDSLWQENRSVPLSETEMEVYQTNDSLNKIESGDTVVNEDRSAFGNILFFNGTLRGKNNKLNWKPRGLLSGLGVQFNTVDGWLISKKLGSFEWRDYKKRKFFEVEPKISYAVDREKWMGEINFDSQYDLKKQAGIYGSVGRRSRDFNQSNAIQAWVNTVSTLLFTANYAKLYQEDFATIGHRWEPINGFKINVEANYSHRNPLKNNNLYKPFDFMNREYTPNLPINEVLVEQRDLLAPNNAFSTGINLAYTPHSYYRFFGDKKEAISSNYPTFELNYKQGIRKVFDSDVDYSFVSFSLHQSQSVRLIDDISYHVEAGKFLNRNKMYFADFKSFTTNPTYFVSNNQSNSYYLLDYYAFNSNNYYLEGHFSLEDNHILLKHLPLFNRTNWKESLHFNYLWTEKEKHFYEFGYGLNRMFLLVNLGVFAAFEDHKFEAVGFRIGLNID
ncbi:MAG: hypothetical protein CMC96_14845 [Flavobacteriales bacterium]|nr:hypothetical protein [Flavobacteriales bacterium]